MNNLVYCLYNYWSEQFHWFYY